MGHEGYGRRPERAWGPAGGMPRAAAERHHCRMEVLVAVLAILVAIAILYELARRLGVPYPTLFVLGGLGLAFVPGLPTIALEPELVLLVFLPPLLFSAAVETPRRELRANLAPIVRLSIGLVIFTMVCVAVVAHAIVPDLGWAAAFTLGAIVAPTDALAATSVFRRLGAAARRRDPHRGRVPLQRRDGAGRLPGSGARRRDAAASSSRMPWSGSSSPSSAASRIGIVVGRVAGVDPRAGSTTRRSRS